MKETKFLRIFIERESKYASYKFALIRSIIEVIQEYDHLKIEKNNCKVAFPFGLLIEKWMFYYYPLVENNIPQIYGKKDIIFRKDLEFFINKYRKNGGLLQFYNDYRHSKLEIDEVLKLFKKIKTAIYTGPMKYLGYTSNRYYYSIFEYEKSSNKNFNKENLNLREYLINNFGFIKFEKNLYILLKEFGSFINGTESIIFKWANFSVNIDNSLNVEKVISILLKNNEIGRDVYNAKKVYDKYIHDLRCVWSDKKLTSKNYEVDHALPYSITYINDLWNLLPAHNTVNRKKSDKIPTPTLIENRKTHIKNCWNLLFKEYNERFLKDIEIGLTGSMNSNIPDLFKLGIEKLKQKSQFLIDRGYEPWKL